jgi:uncharacterized membrane protein HdeD (DUF308 family)
LISIEKTPTGLRILQIVMGAICIGISGLVLINPLLALELVVLYLAISLLMIGIANVTLGIAIRKMKGGIRAMNIGIGIISILVSGLMIVFPEFALGMTMFLFVFGLFAHAFGRFETGITSKESSKGIRAWNVAVGIITVSLLTAMIVVPGAFAITLIWYVSIVLLFNGAAMLVTGVQGKPVVVKSDTPQEK